MVEDKRGVSPGRHHVPRTTAATAATKKSSTHKTVASDDVRVRNTESSSLCCVGPAEEDVKSLKAGEFHWFMKLLMPPVNTVQNCQLHFPDTVFITNGKPEELIRSDPETCLLQSLKGESRLTADKISVLLSNAVRERRKFINREKADQQQEQLSPVADVVILRYLADQASNTKPLERVLNEKEFKAYMAAVGKGSQPQVECIQSCVKTKFGLGRHIPLHFRQELNTEHEVKLHNEYHRKGSTLVQHPPLVKYDYQDIGRDFMNNLKASQPDISRRDLESKTEQWLQTNAPEDYCLRQILKMCHYISQVRQIEILQMKADFYVDSNDQIWFFYAREIVWRNKRLSLSQ